MQYTIIKRKLLQAFKYKCMYILYWNATSPNKQLTHSITNLTAYLRCHVSLLLKFFIGLGGRGGGQSNDNLWEDWAIYWVHEWQVTGILYSIMAKMYFYFKDVSITSWIQVGLLNLTLKLPMSDCSVYPLVTTNFLVYWLWEFGVRSKENFNLISLIIPITNLLDIVWIFQGEITC